MNERLAVLSSCALLVILLALTAKALYCTSRNELVLYMVRCARESIRWHEYRWQNQALTLSGTYHQMFTESCILAYFVFEILEIQCLDTYNTLAHKFMYKVIFKIPSLSKICGTEICHGNFPGGRGLHLVRTKILSVFLSGINTTVLMCAGICMFLVR